MTLAGHRGLRRDREGGRAPGGGARADRERELRLPGGARGAGLGAHQQVRRGLPGQALLRRLPVGGRRRAAGHRPRQEALRRRGGQRPAPQRARRPTWRPTFALAKPGDTMLALDLAQGGHLTHGASVNFSGSSSRSFHYGLHRETERIDYDQAGAARQGAPAPPHGGRFSAYSRTLDFRGLSPAARIRWAPRWWSTWPTSPGWSRPGSRLPRCRTRRS
jgi:hypothetical protein